MDETKNTTKTSDIFRSARIRLGNGWSGRVSLKLHDGRSVSAGQWQQGLCGLEKRLEEPKNHLKVDGTTSVSVCELEICGKTITVAVKTHNRNGGIVDFLRGMLRDKSLRSFRTAGKLCSNSIPTAYPLAAIRHRNGLATDKTVYITEYIENSIDLHTFLAENVSQSNPADKTSSGIKKQIGMQIGSIIARMHGARMWHRDAKAGNFLVVPSKSGGYEVMLIDMDGIKPYLFTTDKKRYFAFIKLGAVLMWHRGINLTDYLRSFRKYCSQSGIDRYNRNKIFRRLCRSAIALRLLSFAGSAMK